MNMIDVRVMLKKKKPSPDLRVMWHFGLLALLIFFPGMIYIYIYKLRYLKPKATRISEKEKRNILINLYINLILPL